MPCRVAHRACHACHAVSHCMLCTMARRATQHDMQYDMPRTYIYIFIAIEIYRYICKSPRACGTSGMPCVPCRAVHAKQAIPCRVVRCACHAVPCMQRCAMLFHGFPCSAACCVMPCCTVPCRVVLNAVACPCHVASAARRMQSRAVRPSLVPGRIHPVAWSATRHATRHGMACDTTCHGMRHDMAMQHDTTRHGTQYDTAWRATRHGMQYDTAWHTINTTRRGMQSDRRCSRKCHAISCHAIRHATKYDMPCSTTSHATRHNMRHVTYGMPCSTTPRHGTACDRRSRMQHNHAKNKRI